MNVAVDSVNASSAKFGVRYTEKGNEYKECRIGRFAGAVVGLAFNMPKADDIFQKAVDKCLPEKAAKHLNFKGFTGSLAGGLLIMSAFIGVGSAIDRIINKKRAVKADITHNLM